MKARFLILFCFFFLLLLFPLHNFAQPQYRETNTSVGKVISGLTREDALEKFGLPAQAGERLWYYSAPENFFIIFPGQPFSRIYLYPIHPRGSPGVPLEFKVFGYQSDMNLRDITDEVRLLVDKPKYFILGREGLIIPKRVGEYQVLVKYKNVFSNPAYITIEEPRQQQTEKEKPISITILPYKPVIPYKGRMEPVALGTFQDHMGKYYVKDISNKANWYIKQSKEVIRKRDKTIFGVSPGEAELLCGYLNLESPPQEVYVRQNISVFNHSLKHIKLLPEFILAASGKNINFRAFGTYRNNEIEDITGKVRWEISNKGVLTPIKNGDFSAKAVGSAEITATLDGLKSESVKVIITDKQKAVLFAPPAERKVDSKKLFQDIQNETEKLKQDLGMEEKKLTLIKITPDTLEIPLGETGQVSASGIYSDKSQEDLTNIGEWSSSDDKIVKVLGGKIGTFSQGEARVYVKFKEIKSLPAAVKVGGPKLVSIILYPQNLKISLKDNPAFKAEGYFSDSSRKDITSLATWEFSKPGITKIKDGKIFPLKLGTTGVFAGYSGIKSLPAEIVVIITVGWVIYMIMKGLLFLFLGITAVFVVFYVLTEEKKNYLKSSLNKNPREFVIDLYENTKGILGIFNLGHKEWMTPLFYADMVQEKYSIEGNLFANFTARFEEAKYSRHAFSPGDASLALSDYNNFLKVMLRRHNKFSLFFRYCLTLLLRMPLLISGP